MKNMFSRFVVILAGVLVVLGLTFSIGGNSAQAADTIKLTFSGLWPPQHPFSQATKLWIEKIEKETQGRVQITPYWAGALYKPKESALELAKGVADIGDFSGSYAPMGFEFEKASRMIFWGVNDRKLTRRVYLEVLKKFPQLEEEFIKGGIKVMAYAGIPPYQLLLSERKVMNIDDFKGLTVKATGDHSKVFAALGAQAVNLPITDSYTALQKTTIDGAVVPFETMKTFRFAEVVRYGLELNIGSAPAGHWGFSLKSWEKLPRDIQKVFEDNIDWFGEKCEELVFAGEQEAIDMAKDKNVEFITLPPEDLNKVYAMINNVIVEKMAELDAKNLPATEAYDEIRRLIKVYSK